MTIRLATPGDAAALSTLAGATFRLACPPDITDEAVAAHVATELSVERFASWLASPEHELVVADDAGELVGYSLLVFAEPYDEAVAVVVPDRPVCELSKIYVLADRQGGGLAAQLMDESLRVAREREVAVIWLGTNQENERAMRFYEKSGFARVGTRRFWVGDHWEDDYVLARPLPT